MSRRFRLDLGGQPLKLAGITIAVWLLLALAVLHDRLGEAFGDASRDMLVLILLPPAFVLACAGVLRWLEGARR